MMPAVIWAIVSHLDMYWDELFMRFSSQQFQFLSAGPTEKPSKSEWRLWVIDSGGAKFVKFLALQSRVSESEVGGKT